MQMGHPLSHIEIYASDLQTSLEFWQPLLEWLGWTAYQKWDDGQSWASDGVYLVFVQAPEDTRQVPYHRRNPGLNHLAFLVPETQCVDQLTHWLVERQIEILYPSRHPRAGGSDYYGVFFEDPEGIKVEVHAAPTSPTTR